MKWLDFLFWHYYCYFEKNKKKFKGNSVLSATSMLAFTTFVIFGFIIGTTYTFICDLHLPEYGTLASRKISWLTGIPWILYLGYRYERKKSIVQNKYQIFRERWGEPENVSKKNLNILLWYTLITTIGMLLFAIAMGYLNKHGYFEGCRLFP